jgi:lipopolysaccharide export system ATP-binding protein
VKTLAIERLTKTFGKRLVVNDVSLAVRSGEIVGLLGQNGAGKTTVLRIAAGMIASDSGSVFLHDGDPEVDITRTPIWRRARRGIAYLSQGDMLFSRLSVFGNVVATLDMLTPEHDVVTAAEAYLGSLRILHLAHMMPAQLSGGERRIASLARALAGAPSFAILDEPFSKIDPLSIAHLKAIIRRRAADGTAFVITDHNARDISELVERAYIMYRGRVEIAGSMEELAVSQEARSLYFGASLSGTGGRRSP